MKRSLTFLGSFTLVAVAAMPSANQIRRAIPQGDGVIYSVDDMPTRDNVPDGVAVNHLGELDGIQMANVLVPDVQLDGYDAAKFAAQMFKDAVANGIQSYGTVAYGLIGPDNDKKIGQKWLSFIGLHREANGSIDMLDAHGATLVRQDDGTLSGFDGEIKVKEGIALKDVLEACEDDIVGANQGREKIFVNAANVPESIRKLLERGCNGGFLARFGSDTVLSTGQQSAILEIETSPEGRQTVKKVTGFARNFAMQSVNPKGVLVDEVVGIKGDPDAGTLELEAIVPLTVYRERAEVALTT